MKTKGFSMIELLVVVLILATLFMIVYVSISDSRGTSDELAVKSSMANSTAQATIYFERKGTYIGVCEDREFGVEESFNLVDEISPDSACNGTDSGYVMWARAEGNIIWCVDSRRFSGKVGLNPYFPANSFDRCLVPTSSVPSSFDGPASNTY